MSSSGAPPATKKKALSKLFGKKKATKAKPVAVTTATIGSTAPMYDVSADDDTFRPPPPPSADAVVAVSGDWVDHQVDAPTSINLTGVRVADLRDEEPDEDKHISQVMDEEETKRQFWSARKTTKKSKKVEAEPEPEPEAAPAPLTWRERAEMRRKQQAREEALKKGTVLDVASSMQFPSLGGKPGAGAEKKSVHAGSNCWTTLAPPESDSESEPEDVVEEAEPEIPPLGVPSSEIEEGEGEPLDDKDFRSEVDSLVKGLRSSHDYNEFVSAVSAFGGSVERRSLVATVLLEMGFDWSDSDMSVVDKALEALLESKAIGTDAAVEGISLVLEEYSSIRLDVPRIDDYLAVMLATVVKRNVLPVSALPEKVRAKLGVSLEVETAAPTAASAAGGGSGAGTGAAAGASSSTSTSAPASTPAAAPAADASSSKADPAAAGADAEDDDASDLLAELKKKKKKKKKKVALSLDEDDDE